MLRRHAENLPSLERATKYNPMYESEATTGYSHYYRRYPEAAVYSSTSAEASTDFSSEEMRHIYENSELTKEVCVCVCVSYYFLVAFFLIHPIPFTAQFNFN